MLTPEKWNHQNEEARAALRSFPLELLKRLSSGFSQFMKTPVKEAEPIESPPRPVYKPPVDMSRGSFYSNSNINRARVQRMKEHVQELMSSCEGVLDQHEKFKQKIRYKEPPEITFEPAIPPLQSPKQEDTVGKLKIEHKFLRDRIAMT